MIRYPVTHPTARPFLDCPVHGCVVVLDDTGRIKTRCPECLREARRGVERFRKRRYRLGLRRA